MKNRPLRVMHVIEDLESGGAERVVVDLARGLPARQVTTMVCCLRKKGALAAELEQNRIAVLEMKKRKKADFGMLWRLIRLLRKQQVDIVHCHVFTANLWGRLAACFARVPVIVTHEHSSFSVDQQALRWLERGLAICTACTITVSQQLAVRWQREVGVPHEKIRTVYNGLDFSVQNPDDERIKKLRAELGLQNFEQVIGSVGRLDARKNFGLLLEAFSILRSAFPHAGMLLVGAGSEEALLKKQAAQLGIDEHVVFAGHRADVAEILHLMSAFCLPSNTEGISIALLEAVAARVPVVATHVGGTPEIIHDAMMGRLVPPRDVDALANGLIDVLKDQKTARQKADNAFGAVSEIFAKEKMIEKIESLYRELLQNG